MTLLPKSKTVLTKRMSTLLLSKTLGLQPQLQEVVSPHQPQLQEVVSPHQPQLQEVVSPQPHLQEVVSPYQAQGCVTTAGSQGGMGSL